MSATPSGQGSGTASWVKSPRAFIAPLALAQFICSFAGSNMNVMINDISHDLHTDVKGVQTTITLFLVIMAVLMIPCSKLTDRWGRKRCFLGGLILYGIGTVLSAIAPSLGVLILGNSVFQGVGTAFLIPPVYILTTMAFTSLESRAKAFGVISGLGGIGAAAGPLIGGVITSAISWRAAFVFQALVVATIIVLGRRVVDPVAPDPERPFDVVGAILSAVGMFFVVLGILQAGVNNTLLVVFLAIGIACLAGFMVFIRSRERAGKEPLLSIELFRNRISNLGLVTQNLQWLLLMGVSFVVSVFLQTERHYSAIKTGVIFTAATLGVLVSSLAAERMAKRRLQKTLDLGRLRYDRGRDRAPARAGQRGLVERLGVRAGTAADRAGAGRDADPVGQPRAVSVPRGQAGRDLGTVAKRLQPRLILRHRDRGHDPRLQPRLGKRHLRRGDDRPRRRRARRPRDRGSPPRQSPPEPPTPGSRRPPRHQARSTRPSDSRLLPGMTVLPKRSGDPARRCSSGACGRSLGGGLLVLAAHRRPILSAS